MEGTGKISILLIPKLLAIGFANTFYNIYLKILNLGCYLRTPMIINIEFILYQFYQAFYSFTKYEYEKTKCKKPSEELTYGETPYITLEKAIKGIPLKKNSLFLDLGCGKGKLVFYMNLRHKIRSAGIDILPTYIKVATNLASKKKLQKIKFVEKDMILANFSKASIVFVTCTCLKQETLAKLFAKFENLEKGSHVISVSQPIGRASFKVIKKFNGRFSWGKSPIYIQKKTTSANANKP